MWVLALAAFSFLLYTLMNLSIYPLLFLLGYQKGKFWGFYLPIILICLANIAIMEYDITMKNGTFITELLIYASEHILMVSGGMFALGAALLAVSYLLSIKIYARREF